MTPDELALALQLAQVSGAAYEKNEDLDPQRCPCKATLSDIRILTAGQHEIDAVLLAVAGDRQIIAFRGTLPPMDIKNLRNPRSVIRDWLNNTNADLAARDGFQGKVHPGFTKSFNGLLQNGLQTAVDEAVTKKLKLQFTGHSKGGALATLAAYHFRKQGLPVDVVMTFGSAQVGDDQFRAEYELLGLRHERFEHAHDIVPSEPEIGVPGVALIPPRPDYRHVGKLRYLNTQGELDSRNDDSALKSERRAERDRRLALLNDMFVGVMGLSEIIPLLADHAIDPFHPDQSVLRKTLAMLGISKLKLTSYAEVLERLCQ